VSRPGYCIRGEGKVRGEEVVVKEGGIGLERRRYAYGVLVHFKEPQQMRVELGREQLLEPRPQLCDGWEGRGELETNTTVRTGREQERERAEREQRAESREQRGAPAAENGEGGVNRARRREK
jgi:hypothetical protein